MSTLRTCGLALAAAGLLASCGSSVDGGSGGGGGASTPTTYLFFTAGAAAALGAVDPANATPAGLITVEPNTVAIANSTVLAAYAGSYDAAALSITGVHHHAVAYFKNVGGTQQLFKASALMGAAPAPVRVSSASFANSGATILCSMAVYSDYANPDNSRIVYTQTGGDTNCFTTDDLVSMTPLSAGSATAPISGPAGASVKRELRDNSGAITGWIMQLGANLRWYQADMASGTSQPLAASITGSVSYLATSAGREFLAVNTGAGPQVRIFDGTATLKNPGNAATALTASFDCKADDTYLFCADLAASGAAIRRLPLNGTATWTQIYSGFNETISGIILSENRVLIKSTFSFNPGQLDLSSIPKLPATTPLSSGALVCRFSTASSDEEIIASGPRVYCSEAVDTPTRARHVREDGEDEIVITDASATLLVWGWQSGSTRGVNEFQKSERMLLMGQSGAGVNRLTSYDGPSGLVLADLIDTALAGFVIQLPTVLADANNGNTLVTLLTGGTPDLFFANNATASSLVRLTSTAGNSEAFVGASGCAIGSGQSPDPLLPLLVVLALAYIWRRRTKKLP